MSGVLTFYFCSESDPEILRDAKKKLDDIRYRFWFYVAKELQHGDPYLFLRAYTAGGHVQLCVLLTALPESD